MSLGITVIIPARYASTRFPGKPLILLLGVPMIVRVAQRAAAAVEAGVVERSLVATDDVRIQRAVLAAGLEVVMTRKDHPTGTDRLAEVAAGLETPIVCNVQGDEPLVEVSPLKSKSRRRPPKRPLRAPFSRFHFLTFSPRSVP